MALLPLLVTVQTAGGHDSAQRPWLGATPDSIPRGGILRGRVVDPDGKPVGAARIEAMSHVDPATGIVDSAQATSDRDGFFELRDRPAAPVWVEANHAGFPEGQGVLAEIVPSRGPTEVRIELHRGGRIEGSVRRRNGGPIPEAELRFFNDAQPHREAKRPPTRVRADGTFTLGTLALGPGTLIATIGPNDADQKTIARKVEIRDEETARADLVLEEVVVSGRVTRSGAPGSGLRVSVTNRHGFQTRMVVDSLLQRPGAGLMGDPTPKRSTATTDEDGLYSVIADPGPAFVSVSASSTSFPARDVEIPDEDEHVIDLDVGGPSVSGVVTDQATGQPIERAIASLGVSNGSRKYAGSAATDEEGRFQVEVPPGEYKLTVSQAGYEARVVPIVIPEGGVSDVRVSIERAPAIRLRAVDAGGQPISRAFVWACDSTGRFVSRTGGEGTGADGQFVMENLAVRPYNIFVRSFQDGRQAFRPGVQPGPGEVPVVLQPDAKVTLHVLEPQGRAAVQAEVSIRSIDGQLVVGVERNSTDQRGDVTLRVPAGALEIVLRGGSTGTLHGLVLVNAVPGADTETLVQLEERPLPTTPRPVR